MENDECESRIDLSGKIYYFLSKHPNEKFYYKTLRRKLIDLSDTFYPVDQSFWFKLCNLVADTYDDVTFNNGKIVLNNKNKKKYDMKIIEHIVKHPNKYSDVLLEEQYLDSGETILHILCKEGRIDLLEELNKNFDLDLHVVNSEGKYIEEVIPDTDKKNEAYEKLFKLFHENNGSDVRLMLSLAKKLEASVEQQKPFYSLAKKLEASLEQQKTFYSFFDACYIILFLIGLFKLLILMLVYVL